MPEFKWAAAFAAVVLAAAPPAHGQDASNQILSYESDSLLVFDASGALVGRRAASELPSPPVGVQEHPGGALLALTTAGGETIYLTKVQLRLAHEPVARTKSGCPQQVAEVGADSEIQNAGAMGSADGC